MSNFTQKNEGSKKQFAYLQDTWGGKAAATTRLFTSSKVKNLKKFLI